jgi:hypothetical protein
MIIDERSAVLFVLPAPFGIPRELVRKQSARVVNYEEQPETVKRAYRFSHREYQQPGVPRRVVSVDRAVSEVLVRHT